MEKYRRWMPLILITSLSLFLELAVIRWVSGEVQIFSYFKNLPLLAAFLGLSIGFAQVGKGRDFLRTFAPLLAILTALVIAFRISAFRRGTIIPGDEEFVWVATELSHWLELGLFLGIVLIFFLLIMFLFVGLGHATGEEMALHEPVPAYIVNILASLLGVWVFTLLSYIQTPPAVWFGLALLGVGSYLAYRKAFNPGTVAVFLVITAAIAISGLGAIWSPYNRITVSKMDSNTNPPFTIGYNLEIQQIFYQQAVDLSGPFIDKLKQEDPDNGMIAEYVVHLYDLPYQFMPQGSKVLIVGVGMGNDAAAALRGGAYQVDAVEIDPRIQQLGSQLHPEQPYSDPRVHAIVDDARSYFNKTSEKYDAVIFGLLDSHSLLSAMSSVRLDSFVYTVESFEQVRSHLNDEGIVVVNFAIAQNHWIEERIGRILVEVFGAGNIYNFHGPMGTTFIAGSLSSEDIKQAQLTTWRADPAYENLSLSTDDWPYLYMQARKIPAAYWQALLVVILASLAIMVRSFPDALRPVWHFWLLGAAFLLIEFKSITELALLFGTTWLVNTLAISGVLLMALFANLYVLRAKRVNISLAYILLFASMAVSYLFPLDALTGLSAVVKGLVGMVLLSLPLLFAGVIFSESLRRYGETARPLASNFSGSVFGGVLEYGSVLWGIKSLYLIGALLYVGAWLASRFQKDR